MGKRVFAMLLVVLLAIGMLGCGTEKPSTTSSASGGADKTSAAVSAASSASSGASKTEAPKPIKIGVLSLQTGNMATMGMNCYYATVMAIDAVNKAGGINGRMIEAEYADTSGDLKEGVELAKKFADDPEISMIFGPVRGVEGASICPVTNDAGIVTLLPITSQNDLGLIGPYVWVGCSEQRYEQPCMAEIMAKDYGLKKIAVMYKNTEWGVNSIDGFKKGAETNGLQILAAEPYAENETDFTTTLTKLRKLEPEAVYLISEVADGSTILTQMKQLGWTDIKKFGSGSMYNDLVVKNSAEGAAEGMTSITMCYVPPESTFYKEFSQKAGFPPALQALLSYDSVLFMAHALKIADDNKDLSRDGIAKAFTQFGTINDFNGIELISKPFSFRENHSGIMNYRPIQIVSGKFQMVNK